MVVGWVSEHDAIYRSSRNNLLRCGLWPPSFPSPKPQWMWEGGGVVLVGLFSTSTSLYYCIKFVHSSCLDGSPLPCCLVHCSCSRSRELAINRHKSKVSSYQIKPSPLYPSLHLKDLTLSYMYNELWNSLFRAPSCA